MQIHTCLNYVLNFFLIFTSLDIVLGKLADPEHSEDFDHEAVIGSKSGMEEFKELSPEESRKRLGMLVDQMDLNKDSFVDKSELQAWVLNSFKKMDLENAKNSLEELDSNSDHKLTFEEYIQKSYGYDKEEYLALFNDTSKDSQDFVKMIKEDEMKFRLADVNQNGQLEDDEYAAFYFPHNYPHMAPYEVKRTLEDYDTNRDGFIQLEEFYGNHSKLDDETREFEKNQFQKYDKDNNGKLDKFEIVDWVMPGHSQSSVQETDHLFEMTDSNKDNKLTKEEILNKSNLWVGSQATGYGGHLEEMKTEL